MNLWNRAVLSFSLLLLLPALAAAQNPSVTININATANRHPINPLIYGIAGGSASVLADLNCPLNRYGGNNTSRYNWLLNADNRANDFYFESIAENNSTAGERGDTFFSSSKSAGAEPMITIPTVGWVAKLGPNRGKLASFSIAKYGAQTGNDWQWFPDAGNGILSSSGQYVSGNDPNDANVPANSAFQMNWVNHLLSTWGPANSGGLKYYILDNEPSIWHGTHRDVHPTGATMSEVRDKMVDYAKKIKAADPSAMIVGPEEWGWSGYLFSGFDQQYGSLHGWNSLPDRNNNGGADYLPWLLDQLRQNSASAGVRLLDIFSVHYYPQGGEFGNDTSTSMQMTRNRSTRSLWDPSYIDQSWINTTVQLIPRLKSWVSSYYPGTQIALTEYNWGAENHINGATAQADVFGILGREGLDMAARWTYPDTTTPTYKAMKMYRNYDGHNAAFGDTSISDAAPNPDNVASFASIRSSDGAMTIIVISKYLTGTTPITLSLANFSPASAAQVWQLTATNIITRQADVTPSGSALNLTLPAQSISMIVIPALNIPAVPTGLTTSAGDRQVRLTWNASAGAATYNLYRSTTAGGEGSTPVQTLISGTTFTDTNLTNGTTYYYKVSAVNASGESAQSSEASATPTGSSNSVTFIKVDNTTKGSWKGVYGADGYSVVENAESFPAYLSLTRSSDGDYVWAGSSADVRALQKATSSTDRIAAVRYNSPILVQDINLTDGQAHQIAYYILDWEPAGRTQRIDVLDAVTNAVLDSRTVTNASGGQYFVWNIKGHVKFNFVNIYGAANYSGMFFDSSGTPPPPPPPPSTPAGMSASAGDKQVRLTWSASSGAATYNLYRSTTAGGEGSTPVQTLISGTTYTDTGLTNGTTYFYKVSAVNASGESAQSNEASATPVGSSNSATFIKIDNTTKGSWKGVYGEDGYSIVENAESIPAYATLIRSADADYVWAGSSADVRALQKATSSTDRIAAVRHVDPVLSQDMNLIDGLTHQVAYYVLDWEPAGRTQRIDVLDAVTNAVLDSRTVTNASGGQYFVWNVKGHVKFNFVNIYGAANYSGLFFN